MTQTGLIDRIFSVMSMESVNHNFTPAAKEPLHKDLNGEPCCEEWNYRSIVGMMLYLAKSSHPDIAYAVHQCTRFSHNPRRSHEIGLKHIARYLKGTCDKGLIMVPNSNNMKLDFL